MGNTVDFKKIAKIIGIILIVGFFIFFIYLYIGSQPKKISDELVTSEGFEDLSVKWAGFKGHKAGPKVIQFLQQVACAMTTSLMARRYFSLATGTCTRDSITASSMHINERTS